MNSNGIFITFEGGEGSGKTTQIEFLVKKLKDLVPTESLVVTREPGGVPAAESIRNLLVNGKSEKWLPVTEALLMSAARHEHVEQVIKPALFKNKIVISDRFTDSTIVYQGLVGGVSSHDIKAMNKIASGDISPDLTIILDIDSQLGLERALSRGVGENRFEAKGVSFHKKIRLGFIDLANSYPERCVIFDANRKAEAVANDVWSLVLKRLAAASIIPKRN